MTGSGSHRIALMCASLTSGPIFMIAYAAGAMVYSVPQPIIISAHDIVTFLLLLLPATVAGFFAAIMPLGFAILILSALASSWSTARRSLFWTAAGAAGGAFIVWATEWYDDPTGSFAFVCTASASLRVARAYLAWPPPEPLFLHPARIVRTEIATPH
jgi:hypothetical protein